ncbi:MAG: glycosyltransferase family 2 protein [Myxococcota bacterium]
MAVDVSICAVTFRRPRGLSRLLESLARLKLPPGVSAEVVLVDNDPDGSAFRAAGRPERAGTLPIRWELAAASNIAVGRNRCIDAARGHWIAFLDDDETAHEGWLAAYLWLAEQVEVDGFFGPVVPRLEVEREHWLSLDRFYARPRRPTGAEVDAGGACTANAFVRRALLREVRFDPAYGVTGGEDTDCFLRASERGARFVWCDEACVTEFIPPGRHRPGFLLHRALESASAWSRIESPRNPHPPAVQIGLALLRTAATGAWVPLAALGGRRRGFSALLRACVQAGRLYGLLGGRVHRTGR